jgi:addiction module HigA family antidote
MEPTMMHNPPHPGDILREEVLVPLNLSVTEAASRLAISRVALSRVLNGRAAVSPDLAIRLENAGVSTARARLSAQANYDLWQAMQRKQPAVHSLKAQSWQEFFELANRSGLPADFLENPPEPNAKLRKAIAALPKQDDILATRTSVYL